MSNHETQQTYPDSGAHDLGCSCASCYGLGSDDERGDERGDDQMTTYVVSRNIPGYLPMDDDPATTEGLWWAASILEDDIISYVESLWEVDDLDVIEIDGRRFNLNAGSEMIDEVRHYIVGQMAEQMRWRRIQIWVHQPDNPYDLGLMFFVAETEDEASWDEPTDEETTR